MMPVYHRSYPIQLKRDAGALFMHGWGTTWISTPFFLGAAVSELVRTTSLDPFYGVMGLIGALQLLSLVSARTIIAGDVLVQRSALRRSSYPRSELEGVRGIRKPENLVWGSSAIMLKGPNGETRLWHAQGLGTTRQKHWISEIDRWLVSGS